jgi:two-component system phosphate regulon sensor histidine kinase PhoR
VPIEYWLLLAGAALVALLVGVWLGRSSAARSASDVESSVVPAARAEAAIGLAPADLEQQLAPADQLGIGLIRVGPSGTVKSANRSAVDLLGWRLRGLVGRSMLEAFLDHSIDELAQLARRKGHAAGEYVMTGEPPRTLTVHIWQARDADLWIALSDVSELRRLRRIRTEFVDNLSHELRTPLSTVRLLTESLSLEAERTELPARVKDSIAKIDVETGHLVQMVNELLDLAKIEQGDSPIRRENVDMVEVVQEAIGRLRVYAERQSVELKADIPNDVDAAVVGDADRLGQVLANIVQNAIKFSPPNSEVVVHLVRDPENVIIEVEDHGPGVPRADHNRIFERFYKVDRARSRGRGGTGLGLAIARHIVDRHHGRIWVESQEGKGSRFFVSLPTGRLALAEETGSDDEGGAGL